MSQGKLEANTSNFYRPTRMQWTHSVSGLRFTPFVPSSSFRVSHTLNIWCHARIQFPCFFDGLFLSGGDRRSSLGVRLSNCVIPLFTLLNIQSSFRFTHTIGIYATNTCIQHQNNSRINEALTAWLQKTEHELEHIRLSPGAGICAARTQAGAVVPRRDEGTGRAVQ